MAYPYVARRLLSGDTREMRDKLLEVILDADGRLLLDRLESLLAVVGQDAPTGKELLPVAGAGLRLLLSRDGADLRKRLLLTLIRDDRCTRRCPRADGTDGPTFGPARIAGGLLQRLNPLAAA